MNVWILIRKTVLGVNSITKVYCVAGFVVRWGNKRLSFVMIVPRLV